jgi:hypothetical protein
LYKLHMLCSLCHHGKQLHWIILCTRKRQPCDYGVGVCHSQPILI